MQLGQAVALHLEGDRIIFKNCKFLGNQDTIYAGEASSRQYFENCYIEGTTDFIFGPASTFFQDCDILCKKNSYITAPNTPDEQTYGFIFNDCRIIVKDEVDKVYLGRPWRAFGMSLFMNCFLDEGIRSEGWDNWKNAENEKTARFMEYNNRGKGADTTRRVAWSRQLTDREAERYTIEKVLGGKDGWNPLTIK